MMRLRFGLGSPVFPVEEALRAARFADEAGFDGLWIPEYLIRRGDRGLALEPLALLAAAARETRRVHVGTYVLGIQRRHPSMLAFMAASLDHLSGGRLILGLGAGAHEMDRSLGIPHGDGTARLREYVEVMRRLWRQDRPQYSGTHYQLNGGTLSVHPLQDPLPVWVAAAGGDPRQVVGVFEAGVAVAETQAEAERHGVPGIKAKLLKIGGGYAYGYRQLQALGYQGPPPTALDQIPDDVAK